MNDEEAFTLPVDYKGRELEFDTVLKPYGYTYRFEVNVNGTPVQFEPDEERHYRALISPELAERSKLDVELLQAIAEVLQGLHG